MPDVGVPISGYLSSAEGKIGRIGARMMAIVAEGDRGRVFSAANARSGGGGAQGKTGLETGRRRAGTTDGDCALRSD